MRRQQRGFILLNTIIITGLLGLLVVSQTDRVLLYYKAENQVHAQHKILQQLEAAAQQVLIMNQEPACMMAATDPNRVIAQIKKQQGCLININNHSYVFKIEALGNFPCLQTRLNNQRYSTKHVRLTIAAMAKKSTVLQLRMAYAVPALICKGQEIVVMPLGVSSWRVLL